MKVKLAPSLICVDWGHAARDLEILEKGGVDYLHVDIMDGSFVPNLTLGPEIMQAARKYTNLPMDTHMMVVEPTRHIERFVEAGSDILVLHAEACTHLDRALRRIRDLGARPGVALNPATPLSAIEWVLEEVDLVLVMTVNPGFVGQKLVPYTLRKIEALREMLEKRGLSPELEVDGNVSDENIPKMISAGADVLVLGTSGLFKQGIPLADSLADLKKRIASLAEES